jgi:transposase
MRPRGVRPPSAEEREELTRTYTAGRQADLARRCHAVLLVADGTGVPEVARLLRVDQSSVHRWLDRFEAGGVGGLASAWSGGPTPRWDEGYEFLLVDTVRHDPRWHGLEQSVWTCGLLAGYLADKTGVALSAERVRALLHGHGIRLKQPTPVVHSPDPRYDPKGSGLR